MRCLLISCSTKGLSAISPRTKMWRGSCSRSANVSRLPAYVSLSRLTTVQSGRVRRRYFTKLDPMNPHPPVTNTLMCADMDRSGQSLNPFGEGTMTSEAPPWQGRQESNRDRDPCLGAANPAPCGANNPLWQELAFGGGALDGRHGGRPLWDGDVETTRSAE